jgi:penicillin-binding protein 2
VQHRPWYPGETISVSVGQGAITATPLQLARAIGGIALGGVFKVPHLLKSLDPGPGTRLAISEDTVEKVTQAMEDVVNPKYPGGTAHVAYIPGVDLCGKSGSAQVIGSEGLAKAKNRADYKNPEIVVTALVQSTMKHGGEIAAPIVRDVVKAYYDKKNKKNGTQLTAANKAPTPDGGTLPMPPPPLPALTPSATLTETLPQSTNPNRAGKPTHQPR